MAVAQLTTPELGEHRVETGVGRITDLDRRDRNIGVKIAAEGLRQPVGGWLDIIAADRRVVDTLEKAFAEGRAVRYRIVVRRKATVDKAIPFAELGIVDKVRDLVDLDFAGGDTGQTSATAPNPPQTATETVPPPQEPPPADPAPESARTGPRVEEGKPWETTNSDGSLNPGSYAFGAAQAFVDKAHRLILEHRRATVANFDAAADAPTPGQLRSLARYLLEAADHVQTTIRRDGHVDRNDASYTRAKAAVFAALTAYPAPFDAAGDKDAVTAWRAGLADHAAMLAGVAMSLTADYLNGDTPR